MHTCCMTASTQRRAGGRTDAGIASIRSLVNRRSKNPKPLVWTKAADEIVDPSSSTAAELINQESRLGWSDADWRCCHAGQSFYLR